MIARLRTHIDLDEVGARDGLLVGTYTKDCLVAATRALLAVVEHEHLDRHEVDELTEPWASALAAVQPFLPEVLDTMPEGVKAAAKQEIVVLDDGRYITGTGEVVPGVSVTVRPPSFSVVTEQEVDG